MWRTPSGKLRGTLQIPVTSHIPSIPLGEFSLLFGILCVIHLMALSDTTAIAVEAFTVARVEMWATNGPIALTAIA